MEEQLMKQYVTIFCVIIIIGTGCAPAVISGSATGAYKMATDERSAGRILDDSIISVKVKTKLIESSEIKARKIDVDLINACVILSGVVETENEAKLAAEISKTVPGVKDVKSFLIVGSKSFGQALDDKLIWSKIKAKLIKEPGIHSLNVDVDVNNGVVVLSSVVKHIVLRNKIVTLAENTPGVAKIIDNIIIK